MKRIAFLLVSALLILPAPADDQMRDAQTALKNQGFYYGETNGKDNAETGAAIRRFQIRNGLKVTGKMNDETLAALGLGKKGAPPAAAPTPAQVNPPPAAAPIPGLAAQPQPKRGADLLRNPNAPEEPAPTVPRTAPDDPAVVEPPRAIPAPVHSPFALLFKGTPYESAPPELQSETLRRAQAHLAERRYYRSTVDGVPGPATSEAIFAYQQDYDLRRTGRLDLETLAKMRLLPRTLPEGGPLKPFYNPNRNRGSSITLDPSVR
jgi:peptidoglycan hydrolase-like protein with peptidoglycan-binding domain